MEEWLLCIPDLRFLNWRHVHKWIRPSVKECMPYIAVMLSIKSKRKNIMRQEKNMLHKNIFSFSVWIDGIWIVKSPGLANLKLANINYLLFIEHRPPKTGTENAERAEKAESCVVVVGSSMGKTSFLALHPYNFHSAHFGGLSALRTDKYHSALVRRAFSTWRLPPGSRPSISTLG